MTVIAIIGQKEDNSLERLIKEQLSKTYQITYMKNNSLSRFGKGYELLFFESEKPEIDSCDGCLAVLKSEGILPEGINTRGIAVINSDRIEQVKSAEKTGIKTVTCGISPTSTISFTSETEETVLISLNRSITALSGREIEPLEIPVRKNGIDTYTLMSFVALRLLLDDYGSEDIGKLY